MDYNDLQQAVSLTQQGKFTEAKNIYEKLLELNPDDVVVLSTFGLYYICTKDFENATKLLEKAYSIKKTLGTVSSFGVCLFKKGDYVKSADILEEALTYGENIEIYHNLISALFYLKDIQKAVKYATEMYEKYPDNVNSVINVVKALTYSGKMLKAEELCVNYLREHNDIGSLWFQLGFLKELIYSDDKQACECYKVALNLGHNEAYYNIAVSYEKIGDFKNAELNFKKMLEFYPYNNDAIVSLGMCYLQQKKFKDGYDLFFQRKIMKKNYIINNYWQPHKNFEKDVQIICDQGFGDHIQFIRYLPFLTEKTDNIYILAPTPLEELFKKNYPMLKFISEAEINSNMQTIRITDLAYALNMDFDNIPFSKGYLTSDMQEIKSDKIKVGLCWEAGSAAIRTMINRTINIKFLDPILNLKNIQIYSFQVQDSMHGNDKYPQMINLAKNFNNFDDTAKALKAMDVVITVDTALAHLSGALGVKTFLILPYATDWRWFSDTETTPWYESIEIFKQDSPISWENPLKKMLEKLEDFK